MKVHMDGARFANAVAALGRSPAEASWKAGVDVLSFGGTKNGCLAAEAVVFFNPADAEDFAYRRRRAGHLLSKMRFVAAQFDAYLSDDLWLRLAAHANQMAQRLSEALASRGFTIAYETQANEVFVVLDPAVAERLRRIGAAFHPWVTPGAPPRSRIFRLVCSWATREDDVAALMRAL